MAEFLVIKEHTRLPKWLACRIGAYLPARCRDITVCGIKGRLEVYRDITSARGRERAVLRLQEAERQDIVCTVIADKTVRQDIARSLVHPLADGSILSASLRLERIMSETDCVRARIAFDGADSTLGRAVAAYLAKRVRFLTLIGRSENALCRLARCLWQTEGIAAIVGARKADRIITLGELVQEADCLAGGQCISTAIVECALLAGHFSRERYDHITARTLMKTAELARGLGISILPKKGAGAGQIRLTNAPSAHII